MRPEDGDAAFMWDMREAAREVVLFVDARAYDEFVSDIQLRRSVERSIEIIGEAASHVSSAVRDAHPELAWRAIIGQRNVLAHEYGDVRLDALWLVATMRVPELISQLDGLIPI